MDNTISMAVGAFFVIIFVFVGLWMIGDLSKRDADAKAGSENGTQAPAAVQPPWHVLRRLGVAVFWAGVIALIAAYFIPTALPDLPVSEFGQYAYRRELAAAQTNIHLNAMVNFVGSKILAAGFFMWLAGRVIDAFRHPQVY